MPVCDPTSLAGALASLASDEERRRALGRAAQSRALREDGTSLLPVGVTGVSGNFAAGDAVTIHAAPDDRLLGKGIANLSAGELRRVRGLKSAEVRDVLPHAAEEAVHRDYFVLA